MDNTDNLIHSLCEQPCSAKPLRHPGTAIFMWAGIALIYVAILIAIFGLRTDLAFKLQSWIYAVDVSLGALVGITGAVAATWLAYPDIRQQRWVAQIPWQLFAVLLLFKVWETYHIGSPMSDITTNMAKSMHCALCIASLGAVPAYVLFVLMRCAASTHALWAGSTAVLAATSLSYVALRIVEANDSPAHLLAWHVLPMLCVSAFGAWLGRMAFKW